MSKGARLTEIPRFELLGERHCDGEGDVKIGESGIGVCEMEKVGGGKCEASGAIAVRRAKEEWSGVVEWVDGGSSGGSNQGTRGGSLD